MNRVASLVGATALMSGRFAARRRATDAAMAMALVPIVDATGIGQKIAHIARHDRADLAQVGELALLSQDMVIGGVFHMTDVDAEIRRLADQTEQNRLVVTVRQGLNMGNIEFDHRHLIVGGE